MHKFRLLFLRPFFCSRRRSISPTYGGPKRPRHSPPVRGCYRGRGFRGRWGERQICKFFREGYCRDVNNLDLFQLSIPFQK